MIKTQDLKVGNLFGINEGRKRESYLVTDVPDKKSYITAYNRSDFRKTPKHFQYGMEVTLLKA